ncbi:MAG: hypothetical protein ACR2N4_08390 [Jatrophihabitans sp.]
MTERVNAFLPLSGGSLPMAGTPMPDFSTTASSGQLMSQQDLAVGERVFAMLSTDCPACLDQLATFQQASSALPAKPIVVVVGQADDRSTMVSELTAHVVVLEEDAFGPIATALEISEFPAVMLVRDGYVQFADHALDPVLAALTQQAPAGAQH